MPFASMRTGGIRRPCSFLHLTHIFVLRCDNMTTLFPPNMQVNLPVLESLKIQGCDKLRYIFSSNPTLRSLKELEIRCCKMLEVIVKDDVEKGVGRSKFVFPTLRDVYFASLPNLEGFCLGNSTFDGLSLTVLKIEDCLKMKIFTSGCSTMPLLDHLFLNSIRHNLADEGGDINTTLTSTVEKDIDSAKTALRDQGILIRTGFTLAGDHLVAQCSTWHWRFNFIERYLIRKDVPCLERARPSDSTTPALESEIEIDVKDNDHNEDAQHHITHRPRKYNIIISYDDSNKSTNLWLEGYDQQSDTILPLELVLQDIHESYPQECVKEEFQRFTYSNSMHLSPSENSSSFVKDIFSREGVQPDLNNYFNIWLSSLVPTMKCLDD